MTLLSDMTKTIKVYLSESEYTGIEKLIDAGFGRTKADFVKTAVVIHAYRCKTGTGN